MSSIGSMLLSDYFYQTIKKDNYLLILTLNLKSFRDVKKAELLIRSHIESSDPILSQPFYGIYKENDNSIISTLSIGLYITKSNGYIKPLPLSYNRLIILFLYNKENFSFFISEFS